MDHDIRIYNQILRRWERLVWLCIVGSGMESCRRRRKGGPFPFSSSLSTFLPNWNPIQSLMKCTYCSTSPKDYYNSRVLLWSLFSVTLAESLHDYKVSVQVCFVPLFLLLFLTSLCFPSGTRFPVIWWSDIFAVCPEELGRHRFLFHYSGSSTIFLVVCFVFIDI